MGVRIFFWSLVLLGFLSVMVETPAQSPDGPDIPDSPTPVPGTFVPTDGTGVRLLAHQGELTSFFSMNAGPEPILLISGRLENISASSLQYVKLQFELLSEDGVVVFRDHGYNRKAEALREEVFETGQKTLAEMAVEPIKAGAQDEFRFIFFRADIPEFHAYRIRVLEAR
ncbi:MAG: hypothetical protein NZ578_01820 [Candidatus Binatia bacterium]|nr:hypothetical protein [Candidatus Binatia bacterium]